MQLYLYEYRTNLKIYYRVKNKVQILWIIFSWQKGMYTHMYVEIRHLWKDSLEIGIIVSF